MCGIAGFAGVGDPQFARAAVDAMVRSLERRGPDSEGVSSWPGAVLGHRRLAVLDLSDSGRQPMLSDDGEIGLVFNGCIYNFQKLRRELETCGHRFRSRTDTEVILRGYQQWGARSLIQHLHGMFAFGIWDGRHRKLILARDRLGVKPLVYTVRKGVIAFASTVRALHDAGLAGNIDPAAVLEFLEFGWVSDNLAIYAGVRKVQAGTMLEWQDERLCESCYWSPPEIGSCRLRFDDAVDQTEALLLDAVRMRLIADVPVGSLLSGGIDSALVAWALRELGARVKCYTVGTPGHPADESGSAEQTARVLGIPHEVITLSPREQPGLRDLTCAYGEPFACSSALAMLQVSKAVKPSATVLLTGDGGDDVFLGYTHHRNLFVAQKLARLLPRGSAVLWQAVRPALVHLPALRRMIHLADYAAGGLGAVTRTHDGLPYYEGAGMIGERLAGRQLPDRQLPLSAESARHLMEEFLNYERRTRFVAEYMTKVDGATMYHAIEARSPFLDHVLWELAASLPVETRLRKGELKSILRALVQRRIAPFIAVRRKQGFTVPVSHWLTTSWRSDLEALQEDPILEREGWLQRGALRRAALAASVSGHAPEQLWSLVVLEHWLRANRTSTEVTAPQ